MAVINACDLVPGMVLAGDIILPNGRKLLPKGAVIEEKHLRIFKAWGVTEANVEGADRADMEAKASEAVEPLALEYAQAICDMYFPHDADEHPASREIKRLTMLAMARRIMQGLPPPRPAVACADEGDPEIQPGQKESRSLVLGDVRLASFPDICSRINQLIQDPNASSASLADLISRDTGLSATLLRLVNSPLYGFPAQVDSIQRAVTLIGTREISTLTYGVVAVRFFKDFPMRYLDMERFWRHAAACAVFTRILCAYAPDQDEERGFVAGLLHDIGRLVMVGAYPRALARAISRSLEQGLPLAEVEESVFGFHHGRVAGHLLKTWRLPDSLRDMISFHHEPMQAHHPREAALLHLADVLAVAMDVATGAPRPAPRLSPEAWEATGLPLSVIDAAFGQFERQYQEVVNVLFHGLGVAAGSRAA